MSVTSILSFDDDFEDCGNGQGAAYSWSDDVECGDNPNLSFNFTFSSVTICSLARSSSLLVFNNWFCRNKH